jgi:putative membrane protein
LIKLLKGLIIGISFVVPGVCSALTAMILSVYDDLLNVTEHFYKPKVLIKNMMFILGILLGVFVAVVVISFLLKDYKAYLMIYFFGLTLGGTINLFKKVSLNSFGKSVIFILGILISIIPICLNMDDKNNSNLLTIGVSGFISSLAFIMPGISGSMLLLVLGVYDIIIISMSDIFNFYINGMNYNSLIICIVFGFSFFIGAVFFSKIIKKFLRDYKQIFLTISLGLLIGMLCLMSFDILQSNINSFLMILISCIGIITIKFFGE